MFGPHGRKAAVVAAVAVVAASATGCGRKYNPPETTPTAPPPKPRAVALGWARAATHHVTGTAARFFAPGARVPEGELEDTEAAATWNEAVACSGTPVATRVHGSRVVLTVKVTLRGSAACPPLGSRLAIRIDVQDGKIVELAYLPPTLTASA